jgi:hypothetical protein
MFENDLLLSILGQGWLVTDKPSALACPKCEKARLRFHLDAHLSVVRGTDFPAVGDEIDGALGQDGKLEIPWFTLDAAEVHHDIPVDVAPGRRITLRVTSIRISKPTSAVLALFYRNVVTDLGLQFVRTLPENTRQQPDEPPLGG